MQLEWEIWLDTHISPAIAKWMKEYTGFQVKSAYILELYTLPDVEIYNKAKEYGNVILISKDTDFHELISRLGSPPKLINIKIGNCDNRMLWEFIKPHIKKAITLLTSDDIDIIELD
jgi:predicted nuclease of predicted toxin-antitoxin system